MYNEKEVPEVGNDVIAVETDVKTTDDKTVVKTRKKSRVKEGEFAHAKVVRLVKDGAGAERVSKDGATYLNRLLYADGLAISKIAWDIAKHAGRVTVKEEDIVLAAKMFYKTL